MAYYYIQSTKAFSVSHITGFSSATFTSTGTVRSETQVNLLTHLLNISMTATEIYCAHVDCRMAMITSRDRLHELPSILN